MLIHCPSCNTEYDVAPGRYECECGAKFSVATDGSMSVEHPVAQDAISKAQSIELDIDKTIPPRQHGEAGSDIDQTMPGKRERKPDGRFEVGDLILERYKVLSELGQGGMGVVYKCFDEVGGITIALKALPPELSHNTMEMEDVKENFQLVSRLVHQNIAISKNLERDNSTGNYYLIMECVEGEDLRHWIRRKRKEGPLTVKTILPVIRQVAVALDYAHEQKIIHRDIKPGNIMIDAEGHIKVLDFGLAAQIHTSMTRVSMAYHGTSGTAPYMAPEQWRGRAQGAAADQYALAVMTYEMLAGHLPFENSDASVLREAVLNETVEPIQGIPSFVQQALIRSMSKDPVARFNSCSDFATMLGGGVVSEKATTTPVPLQMGKPDQNHSVFCPECKKGNDSDAVFCVFCGARISREKTTSTQVKPLANKIDEEMIMKRIPLLMEQQEWDKARQYCEKLLETDPENSDLYLCLCMIGHRIANEEQLRKGRCYLAKDKNFLVAYKLASPERKQQLDIIQNNYFFNMYLEQCLKHKGVSKISDLSRISSPLIDDQDFQMAKKYAFAEKREMVLQIQYDQAEVMLERVKRKNKIEHLIQSPIPLELDKTFQLALKSASPERQKELLQIQQNQGDYFLKKCLESNHKTSLSELAFCETPLREDQYFMIAILCSTPDRQKELQTIQEDQVEFFLKKCMENNHASNESDLSHCSVPLSCDQHFYLALKYASPEQKRVLEQIRFNQSDYYLKRCMENHHVSEASFLSQAKMNLSKDQDFKMAQKCATPEQAKILDRIWGKHVILRSQAFVVHVVTLLAIVLLCLIAFFILLASCMS